MSTENNRTNDEALIRTLRDELTNAIRAKDAEGVVSHFASETVMFVLAPPLQFKGGESPGQSGVEEWFSTFQGSIGYEIRDLHITAGETVAFCHSLNRISGTRSDNGAAMDIWVRETLGFRKISGAWKITHQHQSVPFYMDGSNRAATDLKP
ncbi:MAG TPA: nuclear transport factor 2 family protein [Pyrinomonadaceae bacterium]|jgi:PhnB protein|nr:nuclear transport factor 2 family protein [Pyrinomonadaceae bacterium]